MLKVITLVLVLVSSLFAISITTDYRTDVDLVTGKAVTYKYVSTFTFMQGRISHSVPVQENVPQSMLSIYMLTDSVHTTSIGGVDIQSIPVRSEAANEYMYVFDFTNKRIYAITSNGKSLIEFDMDVITTE